MVKRITTLNLDQDLKNKAREILRKKGLSMSYYVDQTFKVLIKKNEKGGRENAVSKKEED